GFEWLDADNAQANVVAYMRRAADTAVSPLVCVGNFSTLPRRYRVGLPQGGAWTEVINSDLQVYAGGGVGNGTVQAEATGWQRQPCSVELTLPPLGVIWLKKA
ncbi:MAG TPA: alpha amylase C-terminal domain-containing protein, partial [bacterium]|nr:alpha amylase C-terminal domain-containing protein [bacterium]